MSKGEPASRLARPGSITYLGPALVVSLSVLYLGTSHNGPQLPLSLSWRDKLGHGLAFAFVAWTYMRAMVFLRPHENFRDHALWGVVAAVALGALLEVIQFFLPYRSAEWADLAADAVGALVPLVAVFVLPRCQAKVAGDSSVEEG